MSNGKVYEELDFGKVILKVDKLAEQKGETAYSLAKKTLVKHSTIQRYLQNNVGRLDLETLAKIMFALGVTDFNEIFEYKL